MINGVADSTIEFGGLVRTPQTGRIRNYVLFATAVATAVVICVLIWWPEATAEVATVAELMVP